MKKIIAAIGLGIMLVFSCTCVFADGLTGWQKTGDKWYLYNDDGAMLTGWQKVDDCWYYLASDGAMLTGWQKIGDKWYYFKSSGAMAENEWCSGYWLNADGSWTYQPKGSWKQDSTGWWFGDTSGWYAKDETVKIDGVNYKFNRRGYWIGNDDKAGIAERGKLGPDITYIIYNDGLMKVSGSGKTYKWPPIAEKGLVNSLVVEEGVESLGIGVFHEMENLTDVELPSTLTEIGHEAFSGCSSLTEIELPSGINDIGAEAFFGCGLTDITLPDGLDCIGEETFRACINLESIRIPSSVTGIGWMAFWYCENLKDVYYGGTKEGWNNIAISYDNPGLENAEIHFAVQVSSGWYEQNGIWYYYEDDTAVTGWQKIEDSWYYFDESCAMLTGWQKIGDKWYYFKSSGAMAANEWCSGYWLNADGSWTYQPKGSWKKNSKGWWFGDTSGWYAKNGTVKIDGVNYEFDGSGYLK